MLLRYTIIFLLSIINCCKDQPRYFDIINHTETKIYTDICRKSIQRPEVGSNIFPKNVTIEINRGLKTFITHIQAQAEKAFHFSQTFTECARNQKGASYDIDFRKTFESKAVLSFLFEINVHSEIAAHGLRLEHGISFNLLDGSILKPYSFFSESHRKGYEAAYFKAFKAYNNNASNCPISGEDIPKPFQAQNAYFDSGAYKIIFNPYEIAPYACSTIEIEIPLVEILPFVPTK